MAEFSEILDGVGKLDERPSSESRIPETSSTNSPTTAPVSVPRSTQPSSGTISTQPVAIPNLNQPAETISSTQSAIETVHVYTQRVTPTTQTHLSPTKGSTKDKPPDEKLINTVSHSVIYEHLKDMAEEVGIRESQYSTIVEDNKGDARQTIYSVLSSWVDNSPSLTTEKVVQQVYRWIENGYVDTQLWGEIQNLVDFPLPECPVVRVETLPVIPDQQRLQRIQKVLKENFTSAPFNECKVKDWIHSDTKGPPLKKVYTEQKLNLKVRGAFDLELPQVLQDITEIIQEERMKEGRLRILVQGEGGIGKSTEMKHLATRWAEGSGGLQYLDFIFRISLKKVTSCEPLENIIINQHSSLQATGIKPGEIKAILEGNTSSKVLLILDGYDEYKKGRNIGIDKAIEKTSLWNCWLILTSRETEDIMRLKKYMDYELEFRGFSCEGIKSYIWKTLKKKKGVTPEEATKRFLKQAMEKKIYRGDTNNNEGGGLLAVPLFLHMMCCLFSAEESLPSRRTMVVKEIVDRCLKRELERREKKDHSDHEKTLTELGRLAWIGLNDPKGIKQFFTKDEVLKYVGEIDLCRGLLVSVENTGETEVEMFTFYHLLFQQYLAGRYLTTLDQLKLAEIFQTGYELYLHQEVVRFACGSTKYHEILVQILCKKYSAMFINIGCPGREDWLTSRCNPNDLSPGKMIERTLCLIRFLYSLAVEIPAPNSLKDIVHNSYWNFVDSKSCDVDLLAPSRMIVFVCDANIRDSSIIAEPDHGFGVGSNIDLGPAQCTITANSREELDRILRAIKRYQEAQQIFVSHLVFEDQQDSRRSTESSINVLKFNNRTNMIFLKNSNFSSSEISHLGSQLQEARKLVLLYVENETEEVLFSSVEKAVSNFPDLLVFFLRWCEIRVPVYQSIIENLQNCQKLQCLSLRGIKEVPKILGQVLSKMTTLKILDLLDCDMTIKVSEAVLTGAAKCFNLQHLHLSGNTLKGNLSKFLNGPAGVDHPGYKELKKLYLQGSRLTSVDLRHLFQALFSGILGSVQEIDLSKNTLKDHLAKLLDKPGEIGGLEKILMDGANISARDMNSLVRVIDSGKLPQLSYLALRGNSLNSFRKRKKNKLLVKTCVERYHHKALTLCIGSKKLPDGFVKELRDICLGSAVKIDVDLDGFAMDSQYCM